MVTNASRSDWSSAWRIPKLPESKQLTSNTAKKQSKPDPIPTHRIEFEPLEIAVMGKTFTYQMPYLTDIPVAPEDAARVSKSMKAQGDMYYRDRIPFDAVEIPRSVKVKKSSMFMQC
eukprot:694210-Pyramimonas_sp.AAC.1